MKRVTTLLDSFDEDEISFPHEDKSEPSFVLREVSVDSPAGNAPRLGCFFPRKMNF